MGVKKVLGSSRPVMTKVTRDTRDSSSATVEVSGRYADVAALNPLSYCPNGMTLESSHIESDSNGMGKLVVRGISYSANGSVSGAIRTTYHVGMESVQYDLEDHPHLKSVRDSIVKWLAYDEAKRVRYDNGNILYVYETANKDGVISEAQVAGNGLLFCAAYMAGIRTFNRYYPVIQKVSTYKNPPGISRNMRSFKGGTAKFSYCGKFDSPDLNLEGYSARNFFKSGDSWQENADKTWTRTEEWTYTPEGRDSDHAWIYTQL